MIKCIQMTNDNYYGIIRRCTYLLQKFCWAITFTQNILCGKSSSIHMQGCASTIVKLLSACGVLVHSIPTLREHSLSNRNVWVPPPL